MASALDWLMQRLGGDPEAEGAVTTSSAIQPAVLDHLQNVLSDMPGRFGGGARYDPNRSLAQNTLDPESLQQATTIGMQVGPQAIRAYHGTPHDFPAVAEVIGPNGRIGQYPLGTRLPDEIISGINSGNLWVKEHPLGMFDLRKIGTGEGAQGYGHGLYFSEAPSVARTYQSSVSAIRDAGKPTVDGRSIDWNNPFETAAFELMRHNGDRAAAADFFERTFAKGSSVPGILRSDAALPEVKPPGRMYEVNLHADPEAFLNYDKPLSEQPGIQSVFDRLGMTAGPRWELLPKSNLMSGGSRLSPQESSAALSQAGVPGIRYLDQGSRGAGGGTSNYVMFDDKLIEILRKYGLAGLTAGTGAAALGGSAEAAPADALDRIRRQLGEGAF